MVKHWICDKGNCDLKKIDGVTDYSGENPTASPDCERHPKPIFREHETDWVSSGIKSLPRLGKNELRDHNRRRLVGFLGTTKGWGEWGRSGLGSGDVVGGGEGAKLFEIVVG